MPALTSRLKFKEISLAFPASVKTFLELPEGDPELAIAIAIVILCYGTTDSFFLLAKQFHSDNLKIYFYTDFRFVLEYISNDTSHFHN